MNDAVFRDIGRMEANAECGPSLVDRLGVCLSHRRIRENLLAVSGLLVVDLDCCFQVTQLRAIGPACCHVVNVDVRVSDDSQRNPSSALLGEPDGDVPPSIRLLLAARFRD
jgi:hypothetical protein